MATRNKWNIDLHGKKGCEDFIKHIQKETNERKCFSYDKYLYICREDAENDSENMKDFFSDLCRKYLSKEEPVEKFYKLMGPKQCMTIALRTNSLELFALVIKQVRDFQKETKKEKKYQCIQCTDYYTLDKLYRDNLRQNMEHYGIQLRKFNTKLRLLKSDILPLVGQVIFYLVGDRYSLLYQGDKKSSRHRNFQFTEQMWHLFMFSVLANRIQFAKILLSYTGCKVGAALFARKVLQNMPNIALWGIRDASKREVFTTIADEFERLAVEHIEKQFKKQSFNRKSIKSYNCLIGKVPFKLGPNITPLSLAVDTKADSFLQSPCCQTFLEEIVWRSNMPLSQGLEHILPIVCVVPLISIPLICCKGTFDVPEKEKPVKRKKGTPGNNCKGVPHVTKQQRKGKGNTNHRSRFSEFLIRIQNFYCAPIIKFGVHLVFYVAFLCVLSVFFLTILQPVQSSRDIHSTEWLCYLWVLGFIVEEISQLLLVWDLGPLHGWGTEAIDYRIWNKKRLVYLRLRLYKIFLHFQDVWNILDFIMIMCFCISTVCRFIIPDEHFQLVRVFYSFTILLFYFRILRYLTIINYMGHRIIAIFMMVKELIWFLLLLTVFITAFGVAFQGLINPQQTLSVKDTLWRPYWPLFGEFCIEDSDIVGMGREVSMSSCLKAKQLGQSNLHCYSDAQIVLLGIYLFFANVLLLNLIIALFGKALETVERSARLVLAYNRYAVIHEHYYKSWLPPPFNPFWYPILKLLNHCGYFIGEDKFVEDGVWNEFSQKDMELNLNKMKPSDEIETISLLHLSP